MAAQFVVDVGALTTPVAGNNDFLAQLQQHNVSLLRAGAGLSISGPATITYDYFGSESRSRNLFASGSVRFTETEARSFQAISMGTETFDRPADFFLRFRSSGHSQIHLPGSMQIGFVLPAGTTGVYRTDTLWIAYDDEIRNPDYDHDDFVLRATITHVPEPASWALMIGGFGLVGAWLRNRRPAPPRLLTGTHR